MASLENYRNIVRQLLQDYAEIPTSDENIQNETLFDVECDRYLLLEIGWSKGLRVHHCVMHIDIIEEQVWIQANNTDRLIAEELVAAGIPTDAIVLGLQPPEVRPYTAYGVPHSQTQQVLLEIGGDRQS
ncbi:MULTISPECIES: XisI protein [Spirulina sp. CCY15215]|uniref:XisI protein n=1 Tax=Spirulina sp. CCY15215 TaxID=2767591 RepID=UPI00194DFB28|nr:XisI protein [Spirulina major]